MQIPDPPEQPEERDRLREIMEEYERRVKEFWDLSPHGKMEREARELDRAEVEAIRDAYQPKSRDQAMLEIMRAARASEQNQVADQDLNGPQHLVEPQAPLQGEGQPDIPGPVPQDVLPIDNRANPHVSEDLPGPGVTSSPIALTPPEALGNGPHHSPQDPLAPPDLIDDPLRDALGPAEPHDPVEPY